MREKLLLLVCLLALGICVATGVMTLSQALEFSRALVEILANAIEFTQTA